MRLNVKSVAFLRKHIQALDLFSSFKKHKKPCEHLTYKWNECIFPTNVENIPRHLVCMNVYREYMHNKHIPPYEYLYTRYIYIECRHTYVNSSPCKLSAECVSKHMYSSVSGI